jgi:type I restriction-modification system DNA methylase subunit
LKSQWFTNRSRYDFGKLLHESDYSRRHDESLHSFLTLASCSLQQATFAACGQCSVAIEREYVKEVSRVKHPDKLAQAFEVMVGSLTEKPEDFLGKYISELGMNDKDFRGQCFTPTEVCEAMARMVMCDIAKEKDARELPLRLSEPAVGCGAMVIASCRVLREHGSGPTDYIWHATDIDWRMACSSYIQFYLLDIPAVVTHGNTLSLESWRTYQTMRAVEVKLRIEEQNSLKSKLAAIRNLLADPEIAAEGRKTAPLTSAEPEVAQTAAESVNVRQRLATQLSFAFD